MLVTVLYNTLLIDLILVTNPLQTAFVGRRWRSPAAIPFFFLPTFLRHVSRSFPPPSVLQLSLGNRTRFVAAVALHHLAQALLVPGAVRAPWLGISTRIPQGLEAGPVDSNTSPSESAPVAHLCQYNCYSYYAGFSFAGSARTSDLVHLFS